MALIAVLSTAGVSVSAASSIVIENRSNLAVIKGVIRDSGGKPIADATVAFFHIGSTKVLKQVQSAADGSFLAKILPGTYSVLAVAEGFNPVTLNSVEVARAAQLNYGFKLEKAGSGRTLPEKRLDRNNPKWAIRSAQTSRSIYQNTETANSTTGNLEIREEAPVGEEDIAKRPTKAVVETYFASHSSGPFTGVNAAALVPLGEDAEIIVAGQAGFGRNAPQRFETRLKLRPTNRHQLRLNTAFGKLASLESASGDRTLSQVSVQALDEWNVREGLIVVFGVDYSQFFGVGHDLVISPRLGLQYDIDSKTRFRSAYTTQTEERSWSRALELEGDTIAFREPVSMQDIFIEDGKAKMNRSSRLEFGVERVLDNNSSIEANVFVDTTFGRGVSMVGMPFLASAELNEFTVNQQGNAQGLRLVYTRRLNGMFSTTAGFSFGSGQRLSEKGLEDTADLFQQGFFQTFFGQVEADLKTGTNIKTIVRFSPEATIFAIDPFQGRLAIYDPSLSLLLTQNLPNLGLPFQAQAMVDARNIFGVQPSVQGENGTLRFNGQQRMIRGGILVRF